MKEKLFTYYKDSVSHQALIYSHNKVFYFFYRRLLILLMFLIMPAVFIFIFSLFTNTWTLLTIASTASTAILFAIALILNKKTNIKAMKVLNKKYSLKSSPSKWRECVSDIQIHLISEYLIENNLYSRWKIEKLIQEYEKEGTDKHLPPLVTPGILLAVSIPNVSILVNRIYEYNRGNNLKLSANLSSDLASFLFIFLVTIGFISCLSVLNRVKNDIKDIIFNRDGSKREGLISTLEDILMQIQ